jgi:hypothetical protein
MGRSSKEFPSGKESYRDWQSLTIRKFRIPHGLAAPLHSDNRYVPDKIRQQLQVLRDLGLVEFVGRVAQALLPVLLRRKRLRAAGAQPGVAVPRWAAVQKRFAHCHPCRRSLAQANLR